MECANRMENFTRMAVACLETYLLAGVRVPLEALGMVLIICAGLWT